MRGACKSQGFLSLNVYFLPHQPRNYQYKKEKTENGSHDDSG